MEIGRNMKRRGSGQNLMFPREAVPKETGERVRKARKARNMSQARLAQKAGVTRWAIIRLESGRHVPSSHLVHAIERVLNLGDRGLVPDWKDPAPHGAPARGPRARLARIALNYTLADVASASGVSTSTISRFERECGDTSLILGPDFDRNDGFTNNEYARAHHFIDASEMEFYASAPDPAKWLAEVTSRKRKCEAKPKRSKRPADLLR